jgi:hypothetical protein
LISAVVAYAFHELQKNFVFVDYVHADIDWSEDLLCQHRTLVSVV